MPAIRISLETKELIKSFGRKGDTYDQVLKRIHELAIKGEIREILDSVDELPLDEAIAAEKKLCQKKVPKRY